MDTHRFSDLRLLPDQVDEKKRPRLAEMLEIADGQSYLLSSEGTETAAEDERMTVLIVTEGMWGIVTDTPAQPEKKVEEAYHITVLTNEARDRLRMLLKSEGEEREDEAAAATEAEIEQEENARRSPGRPQKYTVEKDGAEIFFSFVYDGMSIQDIAKERKMSPTTVQKLLNESRVAAADKLVSGEYAFLRGAADYEEKREVLIWARDHEKEPQKKKAYEARLEHPGLAETAEEPSPGQKKEHETKKEKR
jgi:transposase